MSTSPLSDAIYQNAAGNEILLGVPTSWSWYSGTDTVTGNLLPFHGCHGMGFCRIEGQGAVGFNPASVQIANFQTYVHLTVVSPGSRCKSVDGPHRRAISR
jgi:hypothetical protein